MTQAVSLTKKQTVSLTKQSGSTLTNLHFGLGWDPAKPSSSFFGRLLGGGSADSIDLDASVVLMTAIGDVVDTVWFRKKQSSCGAIKHSGDNLTGDGDGDGDGDDEVILTDIRKLPANVEYLCFTVNSFRGQTFNEVGGASCRVVDQNNKELAKYELNETGSHTGILIASVARKNGAWDFTAHGLPCKGRLIEDMISDIKRAVLV